MVRMQVQFTEEMLHRLKQAARKKDISISEVVRRCVTRAIDDVDREERTRRALSVVGRFDSGSGDGARNHDRYAFGEDDGRLR